MAGWTERSVLAAEKQAEAFASIAGSLERLADQGATMQEIAKPRQMHTTPAARVEKIEEVDLEPKPDSEAPDYVEPMNDGDAS